jgi:hypothetical protein
MTDVTHILNAIEQGDESATDELLPLVYGELRILARKFSHEQARPEPGSTQCHHLKSKSEPAFRISPTSYAAG